MKQSRSKTGQFVGYSDSELNKIYNELYTKAEDKLDDRGDKMYVERLTPAQFNAALIQARNEGIKTGVKFVKDLVADSEYKITRKAARRGAEAYREYAAANPEFAEKYGATISSFELRRGEESEKSEAWYGLISSEYSFLRNSGLSGKQARQRIAELYYGSPTK